MNIEIDDPAREDVRLLLEEHLQDMHAKSPRESVHALDVNRLKVPAITFWTVREGTTLLGCGALKELDPHHGEIKSMRTPATMRRRGAGRAVLHHMIGEARRRGYTRLSLETGASAAFAAAQSLYESFGFRPCGPFGDYRADPNSVFMTLEIQGTRGGEDEDGHSATPITDGRCLRPQPLICVNDVEASSRWYQKLLGCQSGHGGPNYERLVHEGRLVMQLHRWEQEDHHGPIGDPSDRPPGNGLLLWFEVEDFEAAVERTRQLGAEVLLDRHRNPPDGNGGPNHWEIWLRDLDGYKGVIASPDGTADGNWKP